MDKSDRKNLLLFCFGTYTLLLLLLGISGLIAFLNAPVIYQKIMNNICAWSPTFIVLIFYKKLLLGVSLKQFLTTRLLERFKLVDLVNSMILLIIASIIAIIAYIIIFRKTKSEIKLIEIRTLFPVVFIAITSGPLGEELGWRGYALNILQRNYTKNKSAIILGLIWGFWHLPFWLMSGYSGLGLLEYGLLFLICTISISIIITYYCNKAKNITIAIVIHFIFNITLKIMYFNILQIFSIISIVYFIFALIIVCIKREMREKKPLF